MAQSKFISKKTFAEELGLKVSTVSNWQCQRWAKGYHYIVVGHTTMIHRSRVESWLENHFEGSPTDKRIKNQSAP